MSIYVLEVISALIGYEKVYNVRQQVNESRELVPPGLLLTLMMSVLKSREGVSNDLYTVCWFRGLFNWGAGLLTAHM